MNAEDHHPNLDTPAEKLIAESWQRVIAVNVIKKTFKIDFVVLLTSRKRSGWCWLGMLGGLLSPKGCRLDWRIGLSTHHWSWPCNKSGNLKTNDNGKCRQGVGFPVWETAGFS